MLNEKMLNVVMVYAEYPRGKF